MTTRVLLADDQELVRLGLRMILEAQDDIEVVAEVADGPSAVREALLLKPDVALLDIRMPGGDGLTAAEQILGAGQLETRVVVLTTFDSDEYVHAAIGTGVSGFLLKSSPRANLVHCVRTAARGETYLDPSLTRRLVRPGGSDPAVAARLLAPLTAREREVLARVAAGRSNAEIARDLHVAETTVKTHVAAVLRKLGLGDRLQAVIFCYRHGLVRPDEEPGTVGLE